MTKQELSKLREEIKNDDDSCFDIKFIKTLDKYLYEFCDFDHHKYRVILSSDDYDYEEDQDTIDRLDILFAS